MQATVGFSISAPHMHLYSNWKAQWGPSIFSVTLSHLKNMLLISAQKVYHGLWISENPYVSLFYHPHRKISFQLYFGFFFLVYI